MMTVDSLSYELSNLQINLPFQFIAFPRTRKFETSTSTRRRKIRNCQIIDDHRKELVDFEIKKNYSSFRRGHEEFLTSFEKSAVSERFAFLDGPR